MWLHSGGSTAGLGRKIKKPAGFKPAGFFNNPAMTYSRVRRNAPCRSDRLLGGCPTRVATGRELRYAKEKHQFGGLIEMSPTTQEVLNSAQALPSAAQVELIEALIAGLDEVTPEPLDEAWMAEIQRRSAEYDSGVAKPIPWSEVRDGVKRTETSGG
jgi:putative addiction module component (TIGR02574 family)